MKLSHFIAAFGASASGLFSIGTAHAISLPDSSTCSSTTQCLRISNSNSSANGLGIVGVDLVGTGVSGSASSGTGVYGYSQSGVGVWAQSGGYAVRALSFYNNAVYATNYDTHATAAAVAAETADATNGLAYWGTGGIMITGDAWKTGGGSWKVLSDARTKKDVAALRWGLDQLRDVRPVTFKYNGLGGTQDNGRVYVGVLAQDLEKIFPTMVSTRKAKLHSGDADETDIKVVDPSAFTYVLINAVQEQQALIERQERRMAMLERAHDSSLASVLGGGLGSCLAFGWIPLGFVALRRRKAIN